MKITIDIEFDETDQKQSDNFIRFITSLKHMVEDRQQAPSKKPPDKIQPEKKPDPQKVGTRSYRSRSPNTNKIYEKLCRNCGESYKTKSPNAWYCPECKKDKKKKKRLVVKKNGVVITKICRNCESEFKTTNGYDWYCERCKDKPPPERKLIRNAVSEINVEKYLDSAYDHIKNTPPPTQELHPPVVHLNTEPEVRHYGENESET